MEERYIDEEGKVYIKAKDFLGYELFDVNFIIELWCSPFRVIRIAKANTIRVSNNECAVTLNFQEVGQGELKVRVVADIPDGDETDKIRKVSSKVQSVGIKIVSPYGM